MLFVYMLESHEEHGARVRQIRTSMLERGDTLCTSVFTVGEILTGPYKRGALEVVEQIREVLRPPLVELLPFDATTADSYARIRGTHRVSPADAIHVASAAQHGVDLFLTNDHRLRGLVIPGIDFIAGMDVSLF
jgi:predicted nucleic acid-binding protein